LCSRSLVSKISRATFVLKPSAGMRAVGQNRSRTSRDMLQKQRSSLAARGRAHAPVFAALGDETRLALVAKLSGGQPCSISQLTKGSKLTRQAITKHLRVLESVGIVRSVHAGRESLFEFDPTPIGRLREYLDFVSQQWDQALVRLKSFIED
jgi:DNA-binding transcriptional ArsR family regulator